MRGRISSLPATVDGLANLAVGLDLAKGDHTKTVFLAGSGRSGTTWLADLVNHDRTYRLIFEPFHPGKVREFRGFATKQYLRPDDRREDLLGPARLALTGRLRNAWTERGGAFVARRRLVKEIRGNLLLGWLARNFPGMPMVLLMRHPCAVVASRLALGWRDNLDETMAQGDLVGDHLLPTEREIRVARDPFERHLFLWCIDNLVPLRQLTPDRLHLVFYEDLLLDPASELGRLFAFLGRDFDEEGLAKPGSPSFTSRPGEQPSLDGWRRSVDGRRLERAVEILGLFGLDRVYGTGDMPDRAGALSLAGVRG